ncbi:MAG TPA: 50S ribosomal protein L11 methyltransferase [Solirubrobacterales bacterium]|nr:50S ribosomal protein L11 methyltransferase [Solirubrobacterales bacterium]
MIRLAVRCGPDQAELVLAELTVLAPNGVEEERGPGYVEYAIYGGEGELPELGEIDAVVGGRPVEVSSTEIPDDWADRWRDFHKPLLVGERLWLRPSWEPAREGAVDIVVDPGQAFGTGAHPTTRLCLEYLLQLADAGEAEGALVDLGTGSGVLAIAAAKLGWAPVSGYDHEQAAIEASASNASINGVVVQLHRMNLRESLPELAPTCIANMTAPILKSIAAHLCGIPGETRRNLPAVVPPRLPRDSAPEHPRTLILSGILPSELDEVVAAFEPSGYVEQDRRQMGDWAALLLRRQL